MNNYSRDQLIALIASVFSDVRPLSDFYLYPPGFASRDSGATILEDLRNKNRFEIASSAQWLDPEILYRMTGYARWYFSPTFMLLALRHIDQYEFDGLMCVFKYSDVILEDARYDSHAPDGNKLKADLQRVMLDASIEKFLPGTEERSNALDLKHFAVAASYFNPVEKKLVSAFLRWLQLAWPDDAGIDLALKTFWEK